MRSMTEEGGYGGRQDEDCRSYGRGGTTGTRRGRLRTVRGAEIEEGDQQRRVVLQVRTKVGTTRGWGSSAATATRVTGLRWRDSQNWLGDGPRRGGEKVEARRRVTGYGTTY
ncbi:hypothetical protein Tco_0720161 [Tanacetum coccineum]